MMTAFAPRGALESPSRRPLDISAPALMQMYAHKPLPPLPLEMRPRRMRSRLSAEPVSQLLGFRKATDTPDPETPRSRHALAFGSSRTNSRRRSSYKIQQLTGYDVDIADDSPPDSDCSSIYSLQWDESGHNLLPLLEADSGDAPSSRGSSWGPMSPHSAPSSSPPSAGKAVIRSGSDASLRVSPSSLEVQKALGEEWIRRWNPSYGQFSDSKAAGEYHRIAIEIAARQRGPSTRESPVAAAAAAAEPRRKRTSLSINFGSGARFSPRRRNASHIADRRQTGGTDVVPPATPPSPRRTPVSAFDSDTSDGEAKAASGGIREWFGRRSDEAGATWDRPSPHLYWKGQQDEAGPRTTKAGEQVRELLHHAKDRARMLHMPREERRREEVRRHIRRIPC